MPNRFDTILGWKPKSIAWFCSIQMKTKQDKKAIEKIVMDNNINGHKLLNINPTQAKAWFKGKISIENLRHLSKAIKQAQENHKKAMKTKGMVPLFWQWKKPVYDRLKKPKDLVPKDTDGIFKNVPLKYKPASVQQQECAKRYKTGFAERAYNPKPHFKRNKVQYNCRKEFKSAVLISKWSDKTQTVWNPKPLHVAPRPKVVIVQQQDVRDLLKGKRKRKLERKISKGCKK